MLGRILLTLDAVFLLIGAPMADLSKTHIYNPRWPPHAKFHCAQTITLSVVLGIATLYLTWRPAATPAAARDSLRLAGFTGTIYWLAGLAAIAFPHTAGLDPEFGGPGFPQRVPFSIAAGLGITGAILEMAASRG